LANYFLDTSAFAKRYHAEVGTPSVLAIFAESSRTVRISTLTLLEVQSVFAMKVRSGVISRAQAGGLRARMLLDMAADEFQVFGLSTDHFGAAERLLGRHGFAHRLRTLDALQLAVALDLNEQGYLDNFVVSDRALAEVAMIEGLAVRNPEAPP
jgi:predicted nucleic acid-binding protein